MIQRSFAGLKFFPRCFQRHVYLRDQSIEVMRGILQSRYVRSNVAHKQLARTSLSFSARLQNTRPLICIWIDLLYASFFRGCCTATEMIPATKMTLNHHRSDPHHRNWNDTGGHCRNDPLNMGNGIKRTQEPIGNRLLEDYKNWTTI